MAVGELLIDRAHRWDLAGYPDAETPAPHDDYSALLGQIDYLASRRFSDYAPTGSGPYPPFLDRLQEWIDQVEDEGDQKLMLRLIPHLFYVGPQEFAALYRTAYDGCVARWLIDEIGLPFADERLEKALDDAYKTTWFCPITDSMQIAAFHHVNRLTGFDLRPDWKALCRFADAPKISDYIAKKGVKRLVLLEDFVGSGTQMLKAVQFAADNFPTLKLLLSPLIVSPGGVTIGKRLMVEYENVTFSPVLKLMPKSFVTEVLTGNHPQLFREFRHLAIKQCPAVCGTSLPNNRTSPYSPHGFNATGGLVVMHTNCPNNTLPLLHHASNWKPLFPRAARI